MDVEERPMVVSGSVTPDMVLQQFKWPDYLTFIAMLLGSMVIGIYFGVYRVSTDTQEYLMGSRKMKIFPITMSLIASFISGISILGIPTETYLYGIQYLYSSGGLFIMTIILNYIYLPVFYGLNLTSAYEYLERRFDKNVRIFASFLFTVNMMIWLPFVIYVPALAFNHVTGTNVHLITPIICIICIFYTSLGGLKAVVWTDVFQALIMFAAITLVAVKGTIDIGGFDILFERNLESGRIEGPSLDLNPSSRHTLWSLSIGGCIYFLQAAAINQYMLQRYLALPSIECARKAAWLFCLGLFAIMIICGYCGILIYATFNKCDPLATKFAKEKDQLLPLLVMKVLGDYPGLPGIFIAGILSASLSSLSSVLNAMAAIILEDFYNFFFSKPLTEKQASVIMKLTVVIFGVICVSFVYVIEQLGAVLQVSMSIGTVVSGASLGMFTMGILLPWVHAKGALIGGASSIVFMTWLCFRAQTAITMGDLSFPAKPLTTEGCHYDFISKQSFTINSNFNVSDVVHPEEKFMLHHISYLWYTLVGTLIAVVIGFLGSLLMKPLDPRDVDPILLAPCLRKFIKPRDFPNEPSDGIIYAFERTDEDNVGRHKVNIPLRTIEEPE